MDARIRALRATEPGCSLVRLTAGMQGGEAKFLPAALAQGDTAARRILDEVAENLAFAISHVVHLFHPQVVVLGGGLSLIGSRCGPRWSRLWADSSWRPLRPARRFA